MASSNKIILRLCDAVDTSEHVSRRYDDTSRQEASEFWCTKTLLFWGSSATKRMAAPWSFFLRIATARKTHTDLNLRIGGRRHNCGRGLKHAPLANFEYAWLHRCLQRNIQGSKTDSLQHWGCWGLPRKRKCRVESFARIWLIDIASITLWEIV